MKQWNHGAMEKKDTLMMLVDAIGYTKSSTIFVPFSFISGAEGGEGRGDSFSFFGPSSNFGAHRRLYRTVCTVLARHMMF